MSLFENMESFVELAKTCKFGHTAKRLGITTSSLTRRMQALETEMGCTLLRRSTHIVELTEQGRQMLDHAEGVLEKVRMLKGELNQTTKRVAGLIRVGAPVDLSHFVLGPVLTELCQQHPALRLNLIATQGQPNLRSDAIDIAFAIVHQRPMADSAFTLSRIGQMPRMLFASAKYLAEHGRPLSPKDLSRHKCVLHLAEQPESHWDLRGGSRRMSVPVSGPCATTSLFNAAQAAEAGLGIVMLPPHIAKSAPRSHLVQVLEGWEGTPAMIFAVSEQKHRSARVSALLDWTRAKVPAFVARLDREAEEGS